MKTVRKSIFYLSFLMGLWVIASFAGVMFNTGNAGFWTTSLIWSLLASLFVMPGFVFAYHAIGKPSSKPVSQPVESSTPPLNEQPSFVEDEEQEGALWPEPEKNHSTEEEEARR